MTNRNFDQYFTSVKCYEVYVIETFAYSKKLKKQFRGQRLPIFFPDNQSAVNFMREVVEKSKPHFKKAKEYVEFFSTFVHQAKDDSPYVFQYGQLDFDIRFGLWLFPYWCPIQKGCYSLNYRHVPLAKVPEFKVTLLIRSGDAINHQLTYPSEYGEYVIWKEDDNALKRDLINRWSIHPVSSFI